MTFGRQAIAPTTRRGFLRTVAGAGAVLAAGATAFGTGGAAMPVAAADAPGPDRRITVLTCMDYRIDPLTFKEINIDMGKAYIVRNAGGRVDDGAIRSIVVTQQKLGTKELFVIHHTDCGMATFTSDDFNADLVQNFGFQSDINFLTFKDLEQSVRDDVATLRRHPLIPLSIPIFGYVYDVTQKKLVEIGRA